MTEENTITTQGKLTNVELKQKADGGKMLRVEVAKWHYGIFDPDEFPLFENNIGQNVEIQYIVKGQYRNYVPGSFTLLLGPVLAGEIKQEAPKSSEMTKEDWALKDRRISRTAIAKSLIEAGKDVGLPALALEEAEAWFEWVYGEGIISEPSIPLQALIPVDNAQVVETTAATPQQGLTTPNALLTWAKGEYKLGSKEVMKIADKTPTEFAKLSPGELTEVQALIVIGHKEK